jgi:demethylmenaquinone methyltransferase/2-methoxy-6-polyprenyl-1,4-benzoquinol methylase
MGASSDKVLAEQAEYYRARAAEYDEWFLRRGRYDRGPELNRQWFSEAEEVARSLQVFHPSGRVLELACGTGLWTQELARCAGAITAVDASAEMLALNRARMGAFPVRYVQADLFSWQPDARYDVVFFGFWLSHVPPDRFDAFWDLIRSCLAPEGRVFFVDSLYDETSTAADHRLEGPDATAVKRRLNDGREFQIVKVFYRPEELAERLDALGWSLSVRATDHYFLYGHGRPKHPREGSTW